MITNIPAPDYLDRLLCHLQCFFKDQRRDRSEFQPDTSNAQFPLIHFESNAIAENSSSKTKWFTNHVQNLLMSPFIHLGHDEIKKLFTWTCTFNFPCLLESGLSSLVGNDFNEKILKSELIIVILITNKNFLNHDSPEINRLIMLHVTTKCWRPFRH